MTSPHWHSLPAQIIARTSSGSLAGNGIARSKCNLAREKTVARGGSTPSLQPGSLRAHAGRDRLQGQNRCLRPAGCLTSGARPAPLPHNRHSARGTDSASPPATSCLGASRTSARACRTVRDADVRETCTEAAIEQLRHDVYVAVARCVRYRWHRVGVRFPCRYRQVSPRHEVRRRCSSMTA